MNHKLLFYIRKYICFHVRALNIFVSSVQSLNFLSAKYMLITSHLCYNMLTSSEHHLSIQCISNRKGLTLASKNCNQQQQHCARSPSSQ